MAKCTITDESWRYNMPRLSDEHELVAPGTPLALVGLFIKSTQYRFQQAADCEPLPWEWSEELVPPLEETDPCPQESLPVDPDAPADTSRKPIYIGAGSNIEKGINNYRPAIYVDQAGDVVPDKNSLDNRAGNDIPKGHKAHFCLAHVPLIFLCEAETYGESALIADTVWFHYLAARNPLRECFGLYDISIPVLGKPNRMDYDKPVWETAVTFSVTVELRWSVKSIAPLLREIKMNVTNVNNADEYYNLVVMDLASPSTTGSCKP